MKCVASKAPAFSLVEKAGECVSDYVQVWGDVEAVDVDVIADVSYDRDFFLGNYSN